MRIDVSEVKTYRECKRKHEFSSRNRFHLRPTAPSDNLIFGTQFHEALAMMYLGTPIENVLGWINNEVTDSVLWKTMSNMAAGYYDGPYQKDKDDYVVVDIEHKFEYPIGFIGEIEGDVQYINNGDGQWYAVGADGTACEAIVATGSIDMICIEVATGKLVGFEHKTAKNFRPEIYNLIDEQPRLYAWALKKILSDYHAQGKYLEIQETGPIYLNQVKKLQTKFAYERTPCEYTDEDLSRFLDAFRNSCKQIAEGTARDELPEPGFMKCQMCDYATLCMHYGYADIDRDELVKEFEGEYEVREFDHLDEKAERHNSEV